MLLVSLQSFLMTTMQETGISCVGITCTYLPTLHTDSVGAKKKVEFIVFVVIETTLSCRVDKYKSIIDIVKKWIILYNVTKST